MKKLFYYRESIRERDSWRNLKRVFFIMLLFVSPIKSMIGSNTMHDEEHTTYRSILQHEVQGVVTSALGEPLIGANVSIKGTNNGTTTDFDGNYTIKLASAEDVVLVFSYLGFKTKEVNYTGQTTLDVSLEEDFGLLDEVLVVGYGAVKKSDLTGSVSQVKAEEITAYPAAGISQALQGRAAGVQISSNNGEPGGGFKIRIRGGTSISSSSDPLYVVDGFPGGTLPPPEDIASIEILKDASSTAIYGSRGANGVVLVTTKKGKIGKAKIEFSSSYSVQSEIGRFDLLNAEQMATYINDVNVNNGGTPRYSNPSSFGTGTDWQEEISTQGEIQNHQISFSGGNKNVRYYVSGSMFDQKGIIINSDFARYSVTSNIDITASDKFKFGANLFARRSEKDGIRSQETNGGTTPGVVGSAVRFEPMVGVYDENGVYTLAQLNTPFDNPVAVAKELVNESVADRLQANFYGEFTLLPELKFRSTFGASTYNNRNGQYVPSVLAEASGVGGIASITSNKNISIISENYLTFNKEFGIHNITAMSGYSYQSDENTSSLARANGFITDSGSYWNLGQGSLLQVPSSSITKAELSSVYGRLNYKLSDKYLLTFTARYDGSSRFAENNKWAFFPSGALAWNVSKEGFMKNIEKISQLKLRASYGVTGNQAISPYQSLARFSPVLSIIDGSIVNAVRPSTVANNDLSWESTAQTNIGFDLGLFNNKLTITGDLYKMITSDLLFSKPLPQYSGYSSQLFNIGEVENKGFELAISTRNIDRDNFKWETQFNISTNKNQVLELPDGDDIPYGAAPGHMVGLEGGTSVLRVGEPVGSFYGYTYAGVLQSDSEALPGNFETTAGGEKFKDINGDGEITSDDRGIIGNPHPDFIWGLNNTFSYKDFDLNIFIQGSQGNELYSFTLMELDLMSGLNNATTNALNRWTPSNTNTNVPIARSRSRVSSSRWIYDGSYTRLKNVSFGYNLPEEALSKLGFSSLRLTLSAQNLLTITNYPGIDPEVNYRTNGTADSNRNLGLDYGSYPNTKSVTFGIKVGF